MTQDIIRMAREAGFKIDGDSWIHAGSVLVDGRKSIDEQLKKFANLVAAHKAEVALAEAYRCGYEAGAAAEREQRKPLDDWDIDAIRHNIGVDIDSLWARKFARAIEAAHRIKEKNNG